MYNTYNMGIGMVLAVSPEDEEKTLAAVRDAGWKAYTIGAVKEGEKGVDVC